MPGVSMWIMFRFHCRKLGLNVTYRISESFQCIFKACRTHTLSRKREGRSLRE